MSEKKQTEKTKKKEPAYSREEIMAAVGSFNVRLATLAGALRLTDKQELTRSEVLELIKQFKERKV